MKILNIDIVIIGGGPAGLAAAVSAKKCGCESIVIIERDTSLGGILNQCIHSGFGLHRFSQELTGPEYAQRYIDMVHEMDIPYMLNTMVLDIASDRMITAVNPQNGMMRIQAKSVILAGGCRERPKGAINIFGSRPAGVFTAGTAQKFVNIDGYMPGKKVVILGSGDIGLIMARRMTLEGATVVSVLELMPYSGGLNRNIVQCLEDYNIPLLYSHTITELIGKERLEGVVIAQVDDGLKPISGTQQTIECDTLLLSVGLIPENELAKSAGVELSGVTGGSVVNERFETCIPGIFACGNVLHVHDLVDYVSEESEHAARYAALYIHAGSGGKSFKRIDITPGNGVRYALPMHIEYTPLDEDITIRFRVDNKYMDKRIDIIFDGKVQKSINKRILAPGEMETVKIGKDTINDAKSLQNITIAVGDGYE